MQVHWDQPHVYSELHRYDIHKNLKPTAGTFALERMFYKPSHGELEEVDPAKTYADLEDVAVKLFEIDGLSSRKLMPFPHDPFREPAPWKKYDHLTVRQRLDQLDIPTRQKDLFDTLMSSLGSAPGSKTGLVEVLRWYALSGHTLAHMFESAGAYKIGKGGMTSLARAILKDGEFDLALNTTVADVLQERPGEVVIRCRSGTQYKAKVAVTTIPLNCLGDINFQPSLNSLKAEAIGHGHINKGAKIHFKLAQTEPGWFAMCSGYGTSPYCFGFSDHNGTKETPQGTYCIAFGYNDQLLDKRDHARIINAFKKNVKPDADVQAYLTHDWMNDPFAKGVWSCWGSSAMTKYLEELQLRHGRVVFASADLAHGWRGFVDGAIESGRNAVKTTLGLLHDGTDGRTSKL